MHYYEVAPNQIIRVDNAFFTYASDKTLTVGQIVTVEVGKKKLVGVVLRKVNKPSYPTKPIDTVSEEQILPQELVQTALWMSDYYHTHLAAVLQTILPRGLQKKRRAVPKVLPISSRERTSYVFTPEQHKALNTFAGMNAETAILHGVTGSGKTHVYIEIAKRSLAMGKSAVVLVPEIALTSQLVDEFSHHFSNIILTHSRQTEAERHLAWQRALQKETPHIVIGPRSALFLPLKSIGLIVVDEAHEPSFKQEQSPRYSALRVASILGSQHKAKVIFGSATPAVVDYYLAKTAKKPVVSMAKRARKDTVEPAIALVDMTKRSNFTKHRFLSNQLLEAITDTLDSRNQVLIFHNRRGTTSTTLCESCGWSAACPRCFIPYTLHADTHSLRCHICNVVEKVPTHCPVCHSVDIIHKGIGTKLIETELLKLFPNKNIIRFDGDNAPEATVNQQYKSLYDGSVDIIVGTQVIAKGLDLPNLRTVGVVQADAGLSLPDYTAAERTFQLLAQVVGRVGRSHHPTNVIVQSYQPSHPAVADGLNQNYEHFYNLTLAARKSGYFPPFTFLLKLICLYKTEEAAVRNARKFAKELRGQLPSSIQILGPAPAFYERQNDTFRWQLILKSPSRADLLKALDYLPTSHWQFELDPISLL